MAILWHLDGQEAQDPLIRSHVGGQPTLPAGLALPVTVETGEPMTFYFSVELEPVPGWRGTALSVFATTTFFDENDCIPEIFASNTTGYDVPAGALDTYQRQFRLS